MERELLISLLADGLADVSSEPGQALIITLERHGWNWTCDSYEDDLVYSVQDDDGDTAYNRYDDSAGNLFRSFPGDMRHTFESLISNRNRVQVGKARIIPFPDSKRPTPAA